MIKKCRVFYSRHTTGCLIFKINLFRIKIEHTLQSVSILFILTSSSKYGFIRIALSYQYYYPLNCTIERLNVTKKTNLLTNAVSVC